jgi:hypothetical protein
MRAMGVMPSLFRWQGLRSYRPNLISAQTCVGKPPVSHLPYPPPPRSFFFGGGVGQIQESLTFSVLSPPISNNSVTSRCVELALY